MPRCFFETTSYGLASAAGKTFSPDNNALLMSSDASGVFNVYSLPVDGNAPEQLTNSTDNAVFAVSWFPNDFRILYTYDGGGNELNHVFVRETDGSSVDLTPGDSLKAGFLAWAGDGESFYLTSTERDQKSFDVYRYSASDYSREMVFENDELVAAVQANEVPVEYLVFPDEGHGFRKRDNRITASDAYVKFLDMYLKGEVTE